MILGVCGKSGSGKSTLAHNLKTLYGENTVHLDIDKVGHSVLTIKEVQKELVEAFGDSIVSNENIDRKKLGEIVFDSRCEMKKLSDITWKYMQVEIDKFLDKHKDDVVVLDWILLPITKYFGICDVKILLDIPYEIRMKRAVLRDGISEEAFDLREKASIDFNSDDFDYVIDDNSLETIERTIKL